MISQKENTMSAKTSYATENKTEADTSGEWVVYQVRGSPGQMKIMKFMKQMILTTSEDLLISYAHVDSILNKMQELKKSN